MTAVGQQSGGGMSIGSVLDRLRPDFPDVTISKIRFLEAEGLISPERTASGYRRFSVEDCERLRYVLTAQRDHYLPLKVIKEQLDALDNGIRAVGPDGVTTSPKGPRVLALAPGSVSPTEFLGERRVRMSRADLLERTGVDEPFLLELQKSGLVSAGPAGFYDEEAVVLVRTAWAMAQYGLEVRHLRAFKLAADREANLLAQVAGPVALGRDAGARDRAEELVRELAALSLSLHTSLVKSAVHGILDK
ncbi:MerR family transcriptional regulator [Rhodococcus sp. BP-349]|uniref:transcriptional regulator FtsR n=1 Tax=unclassified Rhodococcus (in: high G+C Gram-positive bacteria) TaxID=192944 RepID=UPI001C9AC9E7|nr:MULTISPECIES: MerR family transcriptional regulator [unclassified Rhodococcus (in: high G+C Gram-positive bacteria)]MBY6541355.1 MerR family transcriptional regulator [Rhodococcus sp. BP-363]MBY6544619.1 MerR family transcriptional regulator [Rhodococcus sp. BP-369]MBY6563849.1 MerR family transcriptional regulator [Rhodococcus sp. BP-370]MBY6579214.1 MerR family transcriptional regulator [Rhodococcus sp. BP-364]MBY6588515.1 MerR family transcriptional regulator [Rhodococcus sp. BP-358]